MFLWFRKDTIFIYVKRTLAHKAWKDDVYCQTFDCMVWNADWNLQGNLPLPGMSVSEGCWKIIIIFIENQLHHSVNIPLTKISSFYSLVSL